MLRTMFRAQRLPVRALPGRQLVRLYSEKPAGEAGEAGEAAEASEAPKSELDLLQEKFLAKDKECAKFKDAYQRQVADFRNLQKTTEEDKKKAKDFALQGFAKDLLATVDNFDLALQFVKPEQLENAEFKNLYDGVKMVQSVLESTLERNGLQKTNPIGEKFDPKVHEAVFMSPQPDQENGTIFNVQQTGFVYNQRVLRAPKVGVVKN